jgi:restriction system protein
MPIPTYDRFIEPILRFLASKTEGAVARDVQESVANSLGLTETDKRETVPSGSQATYKNRAGWAHDRLKRAGLSKSIRRGFWQLTQKGITFAAEKTTLSDLEIEELARGHLDVRLKSPNGPALEQHLFTTSEPTSFRVSPDDRLEDALQELRRTVTAELLDQLHEVSPTFFETIVLDLLHRMGYGASRSDLQRVGGSGDGGVDGVISLDKLGLEKVYVQAKRWQQQSVGRPEIQAFYGALAGQRANKGVFITTSSFSNQAVDFARSVERVVLVDGARLAGLMIDHEVGVTLRPVRIPKIDTDYFEEESD